MAASHATVEEVLAIVRRHVSDEIMTTLFEELLKIPGNNSFVETIRRLRTAHLRDVKKRSMN
jgi:hypothetical protein